jgi:hypothetical protein
MRFTVHLFGGLGSAGVRGIAGTSGDTDVSIVRLSDYEQGVAFPLLPDAVNPQGCRYRLGLCL